MSMRSLARQTAVLMVVASAAVSGSASAQAAPTAAEVVSKYVKAIGGADALQKITSVKQSGTLSMPSMGLGGETEVLYTLPNKNSTRITIGGLGEMLVGTDGDVAWSINPMQGPRVLADQELAATKEGADFLGQLAFPADRFTSIEYVGAVDFAGEKTHQLKFVSKATGIVTQRYFSVTSGLLRGAEATTVTAMGSVESRATFSDYKAFGGVLFPTKTETAAGPQTIVMTTTNVELNTVPANAIAVPDAIKPMVKK